MKDFHEIDCGQDDSNDPAIYGSRIYNYQNTEYGVSLGSLGEDEYIKVLWKDGQLTYANVRGILFKDGRWKIS